MLLDIIGPFTEIIQPRIEIVMQILMDLCFPIRPQKVNALFKLLLFVTSFEIDFSLKREQTKVRAMLFLKEMIREGWVKADVDFGRFKAMLERVPAGQLPEDKRFNPLAQNPYVLYKALAHAKRYSTAELVRAMKRLLECNQRLISSSLDESLVLQQTLVQITRGEEKQPNL